MSDKILINGEGLDRVISEYLNEFTEDVDEALDRAAKDTAKYAAAELKSTSPKKTGEYAKSWGYKKTGRDQYTVLNKKHYRLTHLLEKGHAKRGGVGRVKAIVHIAPVDEQVGKLFPEKLREEIEK